MSAEDHIPTVREDGLQLEEHRTFQERFWKVERIAWVFFGLVVTASLLGFTGSGGYLAVASAQQGENTIDYPRVSRWQGTDVIEIAMAAGAAERRVTLSETFFDMYQVEDVQPQAREVIAQAGQQTLMIQAQEGQPVTVRLHLRAKSPGLARYEVAVDQTAPASLTTVILP